MLEPISPALFGISTANMSMIKNSELSALTARLYTLAYYEKESADTAEEITLGALSRALSKNFEYPEFDFCAKELYRKGKHVFTSRRNIYWKTVCLVIMI